MEVLNIKEYKGIQLDILQDIHLFCKKHNIVYYLTYGTLIGAIRHKGYIPWDDDIDIMMTRDEYNKFISCYNRESKYQVLDPDIDKNFPYPFAKVHDTSTVLREEANIKYDLGVNIDILILDNIPDDEKQRKKYIDRITFIRNVRNVKTIKYNKTRSFGKSMFLILANALTFYIPYKSIVSYLYNYMKKYNSDSTKYVAELSFANINRCFLKTQFGTPIEIEFEGKMFYAPKDYDLFLKTIYGNYMQLPPVEKRKTHHSFTVHRKDNAN